MQHLIHFLEFNKNFTTIELYKNEINDKNIIQFFNSLSFNKSIQKIQCYDNISSNLESESSKL